MSIIEEYICPKCGSFPMRLGGKKNSFVCNDCGFKWIIKKIN